MTNFLRAFVFAFAVLTVAATTAQAQFYPGGGYYNDHGGSWGGGGYNDGWHRGPIYGGGSGYYPGCEFGCSDTYAGGTIACAPKTFEGNVAATDRVLKSVLATSDFASASQFKAQVAKISAMNDAGAKATAYLKIAGINSNDSKAVVAFVGARDAKGAWITDLQRNADLTSTQAETVASKLQNALRGSLQ